MQLIEGKFSPLQEQNLNKHLKKTKGKIICIQANKYRAYLELKITKGRHHPIHQHNSAFLSSTGKKKKDSGSVMTRFMIIMLEVNQEILMISVHLNNHILLVAFTFPWHFLHYRPNSFDQVSDVWTNQGHFIN